MKEPAQDPHGQGLDRRKELRRSSGRLFGCSAHVPSVVGWRARPVPNAQRPSCTCPATLPCATRKTAEVITMRDGLLETGQAARILDVSPFRVRQLADNGTLPLAM